MTHERFSVYQFFPDGSYEQLRHRVDAPAALKTAEWFTTNVAARIGTTVRVIITDDGDDIAWEWKFGKGIVFPKGGTYEPALWTLT